MIHAEQISQVIRDISHQEILPRYQRLEDHEIRDKTPGDLVTVADLETERQLTRVLKDLYPSAVIAGEESIARTPALLREVIGAELAFLIDPVDGTKNFVQGNPRFALMMAALRRGEVVAAWIYLPMEDKMVRAERGSEALINERTTSVPAPPPQAARWIGAAHIRRMPATLRDMARENLKNFAANRPAFCAGYDYVALLEGRKHFSVYFRTLPWDHLPGSFILRAGGGVSRQITGGAYDIRGQGEGLISAASPDQWAEVRRRLFPGLS